MAVPNIYLKENGKCYDASLLIGRSGDVIGVQKMVHIAQAPQFYEQDYYAPSDDGFKVFDTYIGKIGIVVCFDRHCPESVRTEALMGAELILIPTVNTVMEPLEIFEREVRVDAFRNNMAIAMCNRGVKSLKAAYSDEKTTRPAEDMSISCRTHCICPPDTKHKCTERRDIPDSTAFVPAAAGLLIAGEIVKDLTKGAEL